MAYPVTPLWGFGHSELVVKAHYVRFTVGVYPAARDMVNSFVTAGCNNTCKVGVLIWFSKGPPGERKGQTKSRELGVTGSLLNIPDFVAATQNPHPSHWNAFKV